MKLCIIGNGLVSLTLANVLIKKNLYVDIVSNRNTQKYDKSRTLGISKSNIDYFNNEIASNKQVYQIHLIPENTQSIEEIFFRLKTILNISDKKVFSLKKSTQLQKVRLQKLIYQMKKIMEKQY